MSRGRQRRVRAKTSQQRAARKAHRRRTRKAGSGSVAAVTAVALGLTGAPAGHAASPAAEGDSAELVVDARPGASGGYPSNLTPFAGAVYFVLTDDDHGGELWRTDGTGAGTVLVKDINVGSEGSYPSLLTTAGSTLFFAADNGSGRGLWKSDGTADGTVKVADVEPQVVGSDEFAVTGSDIFFAGDDEHGLELWTSDGTTAGTVMVKDINPEVLDYYGYPSYPQGGEPSDLTTVGGTVFFQADDGAHGEELWRSDGTEAGTVMVKDIAEDEYFYGPADLTNVGGTLFFRANDGVLGRELWRSDGTAAGTVLVKDIFPGSDGVYPNEGNPRDLTAANGILFFSARDPQGFELWKSDGTSAGTVRIKDIRPGARGSGSGSLTPVGETVFFAADDGTSGYELWKSDGTTGGTVLVEDLHPGSYDYYGHAYPNSGSPGDLTASGGTLFFTASDQRGRELWSSDGTAAGTGLVSDIHPGPQDSYPDQLTAISGNRVLFGADDGTHGAELWRAVPAEADPPVDPNPPVVPSNEFTLPKRGKPDTKKGTLTLTLSLPGPGSLRLGPSGRSPVKVVSRSVAGGSTSVTIRLTKSGKQRLRKRLEQAVEDGRKVAKLKVVTKVTFTPVGGTARTVARTYTVKLKA